MSACSWLFLGVWALWEEPPRPQTQGFPAGLVVALTMCLTQ